MYKILISLENLPFVQTLAVRFSSVLIKTKVQICQHKYAKLVCLL